MVSWCGDGGKRSLYNKDLGGSTKQNSTSRGEQPLYKILKFLIQLPLYILKNRRNLDNVESVRGFDTTEPVE